MDVRNLFPPYREKGSGITAAVSLPEFEIAGITVMLQKKVKQFLEPEALLRAPSGTVFPLTRREYVVVMLPSRVLSQRKGSLASLSLYFTASGIALLRNCPRGTKLEIKIQTQPAVRGTAKTILRPGNYSKQIEKKYEELNIL